MAWAARFFLPLAFLLAVLALFSSGGRGVAGGGTVVAVAVRLTRAVPMLTGSVCVPREANVLPLRLAAVAALFAAVVVASAPVAAATSRRAASSSLARSSSNARALVTLARSASSSTSRASTNGPGGEEKVKVEGKGVPSD